MSLFGIVVLVLAVWALRTTPALTWVSLVLGLPVVVLTILEAVQPDSQEILLWSSVLHAAFYLYTSYGLIRYMFADYDVTRDELYATGATFTVVAWAFTYLFVACQVVWPGSSTAAIDPGAQRTWVELLFLSFTTLTSTGLSDVVPVVAQARALVMIEQLAGVMYLALVVSRLVGLTLARHRAQLPPSTAARMTLRSEVSSVVSSSSFQNMMPLARSIANAVFRRMVSMPL